MARAVARMNVQSVRFGPDQWEVVQAAAKAAGVGTAQFIRESSFARAVAVLVIKEHADPDEENLAVMKMRLTRVLSNHPDLRDQLLEALEKDWTLSKPRRSGSRARPSPAGRSKATPRDTQNSRRRK